MRPDTAPTCPESRPQTPSAIAPDSVCPPTCHASVQTEPESLSPSPNHCCSVDEGHLAGPEPYPLTITCPAFIFRPPLVHVEAGELFHVIYAGARVGIFGNWREQVCPYVEEIAGTHWEPFTTCEAAFEAYTDAYNREEYLPQLKIVQHPNLGEAQKIGKARLARHCQ
ncbi:hypothetical protein BT96DRAFT_996613 [Gymnopus androsaceus JB14]|uniref:Uncharacterized protein n=1 Tax=Gymnopus androsaceus JB14 TaxID=1447944 RepID=A0A6A4HFS5_9AGAR|nr:hypothetical protein BT96DRAFT_996613 [Gymnopus androsaceus JB14]